MIVLAPTAPCSSSQISPWLSYLPLNVIHLYKHTHILTAVSLSPAAQPAFLEPHCSSSLSQHLSVVPQVRLGSFESSPSDRNVVLYVCVCGGVYVSSYSCWEFMIKASFYLFFEKLFFHYLACVGLKLLSSSETPDSVSWAARATSSCHHSLD